MKKILSIAVLVSLAFSSLQADNEKLKYSVVRISTTYQVPSFYFPWRWKNARNKSGQGIVVGKNLVLTLASNVKNATIIEMLLNSEPVPIQLKIKEIDLGSNLALLEGELPQDSIPLQIPKNSKFKRGESLNLFWKTAIGRLMKGSAVMDRVDTRYLSNSDQNQTLYLAIRSSHPNTGYGVPVFDTNKQFFGLSLRGGNEYDFSIITCDIINRTFNIEKGTHRKPTAVAGFATEPLTQVYYRQKLGLTEKSGGCLVSKVFDQGSGCKQLKKNDVLLKIGDFQLDAWGRYEHPVFGQLHYSHLFSNYFIDEKLPMTIMRDKKKMNIALELTDIDDSKWLIPYNPFLQKSEFLIRGGFVFIPLTYTYLGEWGRDFRNKAPLSLVLTYDKNKTKAKTDEIQDLVVLSKVLPHPSNVGLQQMGGRIITKVNGKPLKNLKQLKELLDQTDQEVIKLSLSPGDIPLWLSPKTLKKADTDIQRRYGINQLEYLK